MERRIFKIPVGNLSREEAEELMKELMKKYHSNVEFPDWREVKRKEKRQERVKKLNKLYDR